MITTDENIPIWKKKRYIIAMLIFIGYINLFFMRSNLSIAIVDMTQLKNVTLENGTIIEEREFNWEMSVQGYVLSSFYYGYVISQIMGGYLVTRFGGAKIFGLGVASTAIFTIITPWAAKINVYSLIVLRAAEGFFEGISSSGIYNIWAYWAPLSEKNRLIVMSTSGSHFGNFLVFPISSILATSFGWEAIFFTIGGFSLLWAIIWLALVKNTPTEDRRINSRELKYITESINMVKTDEVLTIPWSQILTSVPIWANAITFGFLNWVSYSLSTFFPQMMKSLLNFDLNQTGILTSLPYVFLVLGMLLSATIADYLVKKQCTNMNVIRKTPMVVGFLFEAGSLVACSLWISQVMTPIFITLGLFFCGIVLSATIPNPLDIAPKYASMIFGFTNTCACIPGIINPIITGYIVTDPTNVNQWRIVYYISTGLCLLGALISILFISGNKQPWAETQELDNKHEIESELGKKSDKNVIKIDDKINDMK